MTRSLKLYVGYSIKVMCSVVTRKKLEHYQLVQPIYTVVTQHADNVSRYNRVTGWDVGSNPIYRTIFKLFLKKYLTYLINMIY